MNNIKQQSNCVPKIIHYCWFGGNDFPSNIQKCMKSWDILKKKGFKIIRWDESNCNFDENEYVKQCYKEKKWAFLSDYYRLKALYEMGGDISRHRCNCQKII